MPRAQQSKESAIIAFFRVAELPIAQLVFKLANEALRERLARSNEAKARAKKVIPPVSAAPAAPAAPTPRAAAKTAKKKAKAKARKRATTPAAPATEDDLNGPGADDGEGE